MYLRKFLFVGIGCFLLQACFAAKTYAIDFVGLFNTGDVVQSLYTNTYTLSNGKLLVAGMIQSTGGNQHTFMLLNSNGTFDSFLNAGIIPSMYSSTLQPLSNGQLLIAGDLKDQSYSSIGGFALLNGDGSFDSFINTGSISSVGSPTLHLLSNGNILLLGEIKDRNLDFMGMGTTIGHFALLNADGIFDSILNTGIVNNIGATAIQPLSNGKILVAGDFVDQSWNSLGGYALLNADGTFDSFLNTGIIAHTNSPVITPLSNGNILVVGWTWDQNYNSLGSFTLLNPDGTFNSFLNTATIPTIQYPAIQVLGDGSIFVAGYMEETPGGTVRSFALLNADGTFNSFVSTSGAAIRHVEIPEIHTLANGNIVVIGDFRDQSWNSFASFGLFSLPNQAPIDIVLSNTGVQENVSIPHMIANISAIDADIGDIHTYTLGCAILGVDDSIFTISGTALYITTGVNYEVQTGYSVCLKTTDSYGASYEKNIIINVQDIDEIAPIVNIISPSAGQQIESSSMTVIFSGSDNVTGSILYECKIDSGIWSICNSPYVVGGLGYGVHTVYVRGMDVVGNISAIASISVNYPAPVAGFGGGAGGGSSAGGVISINNSSSTNQLTNNTNTGITPINILQPVTPVEEIRVPSIDMTTLYNVGIEDGQCYNRSEKGTIYQGNGVSMDFRKAHQMLYSYGLTKWEGTKDYRPNDGIMREEAARFMVEYARNVLCREKTTTYNDVFDDLSTADETLQAYIKDSYEYGIFKGAGGKFNPKSTITTDELAAIIVRLVTNSFLEEEGEDWAEKYRIKLQGYAKETKISNILRNNIAEVMYDVYKNNEYERKPVGYVIK